MQYEISNFSLLNRISSISASTARKKISLLKILPYTFLIVIVFVNLALGKNQLLMITEETCPFCQAWEREIGGVYHKTDIAKKFPLVRVPFNSRLEKSISQSIEVTGTPTFIFLENEDEIGRIEGFSSAEMFWWLVEDIVLTLDISSE